MNENLPLVPTPQKLALRPGCFPLTEQTLIVLLEGSSPRAFAGACQLQDEILKATGLSLAIVKVASVPRDENCIVLLDGLDDAQAIGWAEPRILEELGDQGEQAYALDISERCVVAVAPSGAGLHNAIQTLRQLVRVRGNCLPGLDILDWPMMPYRGVMLDVSRGKVPTLETLFELVDVLAFFKLNVLQLYTEHTFAFSRHPLIGAGCDPLTPEDMLRLDAYARDHYVELIPNLNSFGHCEHLLSLPEYAHLKESEVPWTLCPLDEGTYQLLDELYDDFLPCFSSELFNAGCDETWDLGKGRSAEAVEQMGVGRVYLNHLLRLRELAAKRGKRVQFWGDILLHHPELVSELPDDVVLLDWHYEAAEDYPSVKLFGESGRSFWVCPGTSSWNTLFPRIENANVNIRTLARLGTKYGAQGLLNTDWGDHGHYQPLGLSWYGYAYGAAQAWTGGETPDDLFDPAFGRLFWGPAGEEIVEIVRALGRLNTLPGMSRSNASNTIYALLDEPLLGEMPQTIPPETLHAIQETCSDAERRLRRLLDQSRDALSLQEMIFSAQLIAYAARKVAVCGQVQEQLRAVAADESALPVLQEAITQLRRLEVDLIPLRERFQALWLRRARRSEIEISLGHLDGLQKRYQMARQWLAECAQQLRQGEKPDLSLEAYAQLSGPYYILGQRFWEQMRRVMQAD